MPAPKGNKFWEARSSHGRKLEYESPEELWNDCCEYFNWVHDNPLEEAIVYQGVLNETQAKPLMRAMTIDGLCIFLDISDTTWRSYKERGDDFLSIINKAERIIKTQKFQGASAGLLNPNIIARDLGLADKQDNTHSGPNGGPIKTESTWTVQPVKPVDADA